MEIPLRWTTSSGQYFYPVLAPNYPKETSSSHSIQQIQSPLQWETYNQPLPLPSSPNKPSKTHTSNPYQKNDLPLSNNKNPTYQPPFWFFFTQKETGRRIACHCPNLHSTDTASPHCFLCPRWPPSPEWHRCVPLRCVTCSRRSPFWKVIKRSGEKSWVKRWVNASQLWKKGSLFVWLLWSEVEIKFSNWDPFELWTNIRHVTCQLQ